MASRPATYQDPNQTEDPYRDPTNWSFNYHPGSAPGGGYQTNNAPPTDSGYETPASEGFPQDNNTPATPLPPSPPSPVTTPATDFGGGIPAQQQQQINDAMHRGYAPEGFDAAKWADPNHQSDKYIAGRILAASGSLNDVATALNARNPGWKVLSGDKIQAPDGSIFDVYRDYGGANALQWTQIAGPGGAPMPGPGAGAGAGGGTSAGGLTPEQVAAFMQTLTGGGSSSSLTSAPGTSDLRTLLQQELQNYIQSNKGGIGDVHATPEAQAFARSEGESRDFLRSAMAERLGAEGFGNTENSGGSGAFTGEMLGIDQASGNRQANYEATLAHSLLNEKAQRLQSALQMGAGYLSDEQRLMLQEQLQKTNAALEMYRMQLQNQQFYDDLGFRIGSKEADINSGA